MLCLFYARPKEKEDSMLDLMHWEAVCSWFGLIITPWLGIWMAEWVKGGICCFVPQGVDTPRN